MVGKLRFLHIEDNPLDAELVEAELRSEWPDCHYALICSEKELYDTLGEGAFDVILADFSLPGFDGLAAMSILKQQSPDTPFLFVTGTMGEEAAIETLKSGATDYVLKLNLSKLIPAINRALRDCRAEAERKRYEQQFKRNYERLEIMQEINLYHASSVQELLDFSLDKVIALSESSFGYIYHYDEDKCQFTLNSWSKDVMAACSVAEPQTNYQLEKTGFWGEVVRQRKPVMLNDFEASHPLKKGYPEGHVHLSRFLSIPVFYNDRIVAVVGVANKIEPYDQDDVIRLTLTMDGIWKVANRMKLEEQISQANKEWQNTFDSIRDSIALIDSEQRIIRCNQATRRVLRQEFTDIINQPCWKLFHGIDTPIPDCPMVKTRISLRSETATIQHHDRWLEISVDPILSDSGVLTGAVHIVRDVTERKKTEESFLEMQAQLMQQDKLATIGQLAAGVAHEINNPMGFVGSNMVTLRKYVEKYNHYIDGLEQEIKSSSSGALPEPVQTLRRSLKLDYMIHDINALLDENIEGIERVERIVHDLSTFSRSASSISDSADLNSCLESTVNILMNEIKYSAVLIREYGELPEVQCNAQQINQVFMNLLINALHAIQDKGEELGEIVVRSWGDDDNAFVSVYDTGCGIPAVNMPKIFDAFFTTKEIGKGTGLGLSISLDIIRRHGGEIMVKSEVGIGSTFTIRLPVAGTAGSAVNQN